MSTSAIKGGFASFFSILRSRDPAKREILESIVLIEKMLRSLESTRKSLETLAEEYKKKAKTPGQDSEIAKIIEEEAKNVHAYLSLITKTVHDLTRVKYRLETLTHIEEPLKVIPEILRELKNIEPELERINPQLLTHIKMLEQRVTSILVATSPALQNNTSVYYQLRAGEAENSIAQQAPVQHKHISSEQTSTSSKREVASEKQATPLTTTPPGSILKEHVSELRKEVRESNTLPLHIIEQWVLNELKITAGVLDLGIFAKKYGVPREKILEALYSLEKKGLIRIRRK